MQAAWFGGVQGFVVNDQLAGKVPIFFMFYREVGSQAIVVGGVVQFVIATNVCVFNGKIRDKAHHPGYYNISEPAHWQSLLHLSGRQSV